MNNRLEQDCDQQRRKVVKGLAIAASSPVWAQFIPFFSNVAVAAEPVSLERFIKLSRRVTGFTRLDNHTSLNIMLMLHDEPWGKEHMQRLAQKVLFGEKSSTIDFNNLDDGERWFFQHLLTTWMTGIYFHQRGNQMISYRHALMHESLLDVRPVPGECGEAFGFWQYHPEEVEEKNSG